MGVQLPARCMAGLGNTLFWILFLDALICSVYFITLSAHTLSLGSFPMDALFNPHGQAPPAFEIGKREQNFISNTSGSAFEF